MACGHKEKGNDLDYETICAECAPRDDLDWIDGSTIDDLDSFDEGNHCYYS